MRFNEEAERALDEFVEETTEARREENLIYHEGCAIITAPTGAPPEYITVMVDGVNDPNIMWRGMPPTPAIGDEVLVWENPISHRREIATASGATGTTGGGSWCQKITVAKCGGDFTLLSAAVAWINALPVGEAPSATRLYAVNILGGTFVEVANVTVPQYVHVGGEGEGTVLDMGDATLIISSNTSLGNVVVTSTGLGLGYAIWVNGVEAMLRDVRCVITNASTCIYISERDLKAYHVTCQATAANAYGFSFLDATLGLLWDCQADDATNFDIALYIGDSTNPSTVTTKFGEFHGLTDDVYVDTNNTWSHFCTNFDPDNSTILGTETPLLHGKTNFDDVVTFENGLTYDGASAANVITVPDNVAQALNLVDTGGLEYLRVVSLNAQPIIDFNNAQADVDIYLRSLALDAVFVEGATGAITLGGPSMTVPDGWQLGQAAGPLVTFDDTNNYLEITGCDVIIGGNIPTATFHVISTIGSIARFVSNVNNWVGMFFQGTDAAGLPFIQLDNLANGTNAFFYLSVAGDFIFINSGGNDFVIDSTGAIGFGTAAPGSITEWNMADQDVEIVDAHVATGVATIIGVIEWQLAGVTGYTPVYQTYS